MVGELTAGNEIRAGKRTEAGEQEEGCLLRYMGHSTAFGKPLHL